MKTKTQVSFAVTGKLISAFVFAKRIVQSLFYLTPKFQDSSDLLSLHSPVCVRPGRKPRRSAFSQRGKHLYFDHRYPVGRVSFHPMTSDPRVHAWGGARSQYLVYLQKEVFLFLKNSRSLYLCNPGAVAWWLTPWTPDPEVRGSSIRVPCCVLEQDIFTPQKYL